MKNLAVSFMLLVILLTGVSSVWAQAKPACCQAKAHCCQVKAGCCQSK
jgi:uncharacterized protein YceK